jgi:hypothetical protein
MTHPGYTILAIPGLPGSSIQGQAVIYFSCIYSEPVILHLISIFFAVEGLMKNYFV